MKIDFKIEARRVITEIVYYHDDLCYYDRYTNKERDLLVKEIKEVLKDIEVVLDRLKTLVP